MLLDLLPQAMKLKYTMIMRLGAISRLTADYDKAHHGSPGVLMVIGTSPIMASGPGTVLDQLLSLAGGHNVARDATMSAPTYDKEKLQGLAPDVVLLFDPQGQPLGDLSTDARLAGLRGVDVPAVKHHQVFLIADPMAMLPSSTLDKTAGIMAKALHPALTDQIDEILKSSMTELSRKNDIDALSANPATPQAETPGTPGTTGSAPGVGESSQGDAAKTDHSVTTQPAPTQPASEPASTQPAAA
jgi:hypothetical protein